MSGRRARTDFTENLEAVARGVRQLEEIHDPILREAVAAALRLRARELRLDATARSRMRSIVLAGLEPRRPSLADRLFNALVVVGRPAPVLVRGLMVVVLLAGSAGGATVASADSLPDEPLYALKLAGEQLRLAIASGPADRAMVELSIAEHRLGEAERLAAAGRADAAIVATATYGASLADAAADLASVEAVDPRGAALVQQLQATLAASQQRVALTAQKLAADARTAGTAAVLATVSATAAPSTDSPATRIADQAAAITARLSSVADARARIATPRPSARASASAAAATPTSPVGTVPPNAGTAGGRAIPSGAPARPATTARPTATPDGDASDEDEGPSATAAPPVDPAAARHAAERARQAAAEARAAAEKAKRAGSRSPSLPPVRR